MMRKVSLTFLLAIAGIFLILGGAGILLFGLTVIFTGHG